MNKLAEKHYSLKMTELGADTQPHIGELASQTHHWRRFFQRLQTWTPSKFLEETVISLTLYLYETMKFCNFAAAL